MDSAPLLYKASHRQVSALAGPLLSLTDGTYQS